MKNLILIIVLTLNFGCKEKNENYLKTTSVPSTSFMEEKSCFENQKLKEKIGDFHFKFEDKSFKLENIENGYNLLIDKKKYKTKLNLESPQTNVWYFKCKKQEIIFVEGDDYYGSVFFAYLFENEDLYYLGTFSVLQPNVEQEGVFKKNFEITLDQNQVEIISYLNDKIHKTFLLNEKVKIEKDITASIISRSDRFDLIGNWKVDCEDARSMNIKNEKEIFLVVQGNQIAVNMIKLNKSTDDKYFYKLEKKPLNLGSGGNSLPWKSFINEEEIAEIKLLSNSEMEFKWLGFYNMDTKSRDMTDCEFTINSGQNPVILKKCE